MCSLQNCLSHTHTHIYQYIAKKVRKLTTIDIICHVDLNHYTSYTLRKALGKLLVICFYAWFDKCMSLRVGSHCSCCWLHRCVVCQPFRGSQIIYIVSDCNTRVMCFLEGYLCQFWYIFGEMYQNWHKYPPGKCYSRRNVTVGVSTKRCIHIFWIVSW